MKKIISILFASLVLLISVAPISAIADGSAPKLKSISFNNASIDGKFSPDVYDYTITLEDQSLTPSLKDYKIQGNAEILITYSTDEAKHPDGVIATLEYENGTAVYTFKYSNALEKPAAGNLLASVSCELGEVYPAINETDTAYKLYIPKDLEEIKLTAVTKEIGAYCDAPSSIVLNTNQEPVLTLNVTASNGEIRRYTLKVKRLNKTCKQVKNEMAQEGFTSIVDGELFYQKPAFNISILVAIVVAILAIATVIIMKKRASKTSNTNETNEVENDD